MATVTERKTREYLGSRVDVSPNDVRYLSDLAGAALGKYVVHTTSTKGRQARTTAGRSATSARQSRQRYVGLEKSVVRWALRNNAALAEQINIALALWGSPLRFRGFAKPARDEPDLWATFTRVDAPRRILYLAIDIKASSGRDAAERITSESNAAALACAGGAPGSPEKAKARLDEGRVGHGYVVVSFEMLADGSGAHHTVSYNLFFGDPEAWAWGAGKYPELRGDHATLARTARTQVLEASMRDTCYGFLRRLVRRQHDWAVGLLAAADARLALLEAEPVVA